MSTITKRVTRAKKELSPEELQAKQELKAAKHREHSKTYYQRKKYLDMIENPDIKKMAKQYVSGAYTPEMAVLICKLFALYDQAMTYTPPEIPHEHEWTLKYLRVICTKTLYHVGRKIKHLPKSMKDRPTPVEKAFLDEVQQDMQSLARLEEIIKDYDLSEGVEEAASAEAVVSSESDDELRSSQAVVAPEMGSD